MQNSNKQRESRRADDRQSNFDQNRRYGSSQNRSQNWRFTLPAEGTGAKDSNRRQYSQSLGQNFRGESSQGHRPKSGRPMGFKLLEGLLEKENEDLVLTLFNDRRGFPQLLAQPDLSNDLIVLILKVLAKVCDCEFHSSKISILQTSLEPFVGKLMKFIMELPLQRPQQKRNSKHFWSNCDDFWNNLIKVCQHVIDIIPTFATNILPQLLKATKLTIPNIESEHSLHISDEFKTSIGNLYACVSKLEEEYEKKRVKQKTFQDNGEEEEPPDDFRQISVYPNSAEILTNERGFLRKNVVKGSYNNVHHYLDVQFRLLREDFVGPLREGINNYVNPTANSKRLENIKIYDKIKFLNVETCNSEHCVRIKFNYNPKKRPINFENSKRLMYGGLLCFSRDNFKTMIFGKVANRDLKLLKEGEVIVAFDDSVNILYDTFYTMVECAVYFEPYYHVLTVLKSMPENNFPMERYILYVSSTVNPPGYLMEKRDTVTFSIDKVKFSPFNWPSNNFYNLNETQATAFQAALTQEFTIIQGPPGTGKTFLGLRIAETLLRNSEIWYKRTPMLVICFTNHALDQFLEGILSTTDEILRIGSQSKNETLNRYNIRNKQDRLDPTVNNKRKEVAHCLTKIKNVNENLRHINYYRSVIDFEVFADVIPNFAETWFYLAKWNEVRDWLLGGRETQKIVEQKNETRPLHIEGEVNDVAIDNDSNEDNFEELNQGNEIQDEDFDDLLRVEVHLSKPLVLLTNMERDMSNLRTKLDIYLRNESPTLEEMFLEEKAKIDLDELEINYNYLKMRLQEGKKKLFVLKPEKTDLKNPRNMLPNDRWDLYFYWLNLYKEKLKANLIDLDKKFKKVYKIYNELREIEDTRRMKDALVIGMTTTCAARLRSSIQALKSPIVIVEEAAEVLESHIITSLNSHCQHLILIGDHQQLKPSTADFQVERKYQLGISLFERMILNNLTYYTLDVQHRMRPEISCLIRPNIYPNLKDHESVLQRPPITGVDSCVFFVDHKQLEQTCSDTSKKNIHEAEFIIALARHLVLNGYESRNITILAAYLGQMFELMKLRAGDRNLLEGVRIAVLDNYQGEECDIILLSLVRSNNEKKIGFLSIENRVCVALSRARNGFYLIGNMSQLCGQSELWQKIKATLEAQNSLGPSLPLRCQVHTDTVTHVASASDFRPISEGGCSRICQAALACGHTCTSLCHIQDRDHKRFNCLAECRKQLCDNDESHICTKKCFQECGPCTYLVQRVLVCQHKAQIHCHIDPKLYSCIVPVSTQLLCGHTVDKPCFRDADKYKCPFLCDTKVEPCGHSCSFSCHIRDDPDHINYKCMKPCAKYRKNCTTKIETHMCNKRCYDDCSLCDIPVRKCRTVCPHVYTIPCWQDVNDIMCEKPCKKVLSCGHNCKNKCFQSCGDCVQIVEKVVPECGHKIKIRCCEDATRAKCNGKCPLKLACGHNCTNKCKEDCTTDCKAIVGISTAGKCGHVIGKIQCGMLSSGKYNEDDLIAFCEEPCGTMLKCGHKCSGTCGKCYQGRIHKRCIEKCGATLICNHSCPIPCRQACKPCKQNCGLKCKHSACKKTCGEPCTPCKEQCARKCAHQKCKNFCGILCNVPPCNESCNKKLKCGHACIGFCGEPCPPKCMKCNEDEVLECFFGTEDKTSRFVLLQDCNHIVESEGMDMWLKQDDNEIKLKVCPKCKTPIVTTLRYSNYVKRTMLDVMKIKRKLNGSPEENELKRKDLFVELQRIIEKFFVKDTVLLHCKTLQKVLTALKQRLQNIKQNRRQTVNLSEVNGISSKIQIIKHIHEICNNIQHSKLTYVENQIDFICKVLLREEDCMTDQEIDDISNEISRLVRLAQLQNIEIIPAFQCNYPYNKDLKNDADQARAAIKSIKRFTETEDVFCKNLLDKLNETMSNPIKISEKERREILQAVGLSKGHWFKCRNGHVYAIGECGGAMQVGKCNECGAKIGGNSHRLLGDNNLASEMDGARHPAWSQAADLANYRLFF